MPSQRTFVAVGLSDDARGHLVDQVAPLRSDHDEVAWARPDGWHVTLAFLGELDDDQRAEVVTVLTAAIPAAFDFAPDEIEAAGGHRVGDLRLQRPVTLGAALGLATTHDGWLTGLHEAVMQALSQSFDLPEEDEYRPHLTLGRMRGRKRAVNVVSALSHGWEPVVWRPEEVGVWVSHLGEGPAAYEVIATIPLPDPGSR